MGQIDSLREQDMKHVAATYRVFNICFAGATSFPEQNEIVLLTHIPYLVVDSFPLAARSSEPIHFFKHYSGQLEGICTRCCHRRCWLNSLLLASVNNANIHNLSSKPFL